MTTRDIYDNNGNLIGVELIDDEPDKKIKLTLKEYIRIWWSCVKDRFTKPEPCEHGVCHETCDLCFGGTMRGDIKDDD